MTDIRNIQAPQRVIYNHAPAGATPTSDITGHSYPVYYTRTIWSGTYTWRLTENGNRIRARFRDIDNEYLIPLYLENAGTYTGTSADWQHIANNQFRFLISGGFTNGDYIQFGNMCTQIVEASGNVYSVLPVPTLTAGMVVTNTAFFIKGQELDPLDKQYGASVQERSTDITFAWRELL